MKTKQLRGFFGMRFAHIVSLVHYCHITFLVTPTFGGGGGIVRKMAGHK